MKCFEEYFNNILVKLHQSWCCCTWNKRLQICYLFSCFGDLYTGIRPITFGKIAI